MNSPKASGEQALRARIAELEAENVRLRSRGSEGPDLRAVADALPVLLSYVDREHRYRFNNKAYEEWFGHSSRELRGKHMREVLGDDAYDGLKPLVDRVLAGEKLSFEQLVPYKDAGARHVAIDYVPDRRGDAVAGFFALVRDISESKRVEEALRESEARFRRIADSSPVIMWVTRPDRKRDFVNQAYLEFLGMTREEASDFDWRRLIHPDDLERIISESLAGEASLRTFTLEGRYRRADGEWRWLRSVSQPRFGPDGDPNGFIGVAHDVTEMRLAESALRESEARFRAMADSAPVPAWVTGPEGIEFANQALAEYAGRPAEELTGQVWTTLIHPDDLASVVARRADAWEKGEPYSFEARFRRGDGEWRWLLVSSRPRRDVDGKLLGFVGMAVDLTEMRAANEKLRESEDRLRLATDAASVGVWDFYPQQDVLRWDARTKAAFGLSESAEVHYDLFLNGLHPEDRTPVVAAVQRAFDPDGPGTFDAEYRTIGLEDGVERWIAARGRAFFEGGQAVRFVGTVLDITAQKQAAAALTRSEAALREQTRTLETLNDVATNLAGELDLQRVVQMVTDAGVEMSGAQFGAFFYNVITAAGESYMLYTISGVDRAEFEKFPMPRNTEVFHPTFSGAGPVRSEDITKDPRYGRNEPHYGMPQGHLPVRSYLAAPVTSRTGEVIGGLFFGHAEPGMFTERHERLLVGIAGQAAVAIDNARLFEAAQREIAERRRAQEALAELNQSLEQRVADAIAERERIEEALRQSQKMEAVGQLTGGIAHDFNNLLTVITGNLELAQRQIADSGNARLERNIASALTGAERAAVLTQRLLAFSRRQPLAPKPTDPNRLVSGMSELLHRSLGETIEVETVLGAGVWRIEIDPHQLENAILNLALNARDAMANGGKLTIETMNTHLDRSYVTEHSEVAPGQYVAICVTDTGVGMDADTLGRAYEPFFTTKEVGKGTGLGLSMVYGFVKQSGGHVKIYSEPGQGTTVRIYLPRLAEDVPEEDRGKVELAPEGSARETILVCEDDHDVRAYTVEVLRELGYRVIEAADGPSALRLLEEDGAVDLLFTDVVLPGGMNGEVLARQARAVRPSLKVLFTTGYARNAIVHQGRLDPGVELITKPFAYAELAARVRDMLDATE